MTNLPARQEQIVPTEASESERKAIALVLEKALKISPTVKLRYVERETENSNVLLVVGLQTDDIDDSENFALYAIAHDLDDIDGVNVVVTRSSMPTYGNQLLRLRDFLPAEKISAEAKEPVVFKNPFWRKAHEPYRGVLLYGLPMSILTVLFMIYGYLPTLKWAQHNYPEIFPGGESVPVKYERKIDDVNKRVDDSLKDIESQIERSEKLNLTDEQVQELKKERDLLLKAKADLTTR